MHLIRQSDTSDLLPMQEGPRPSDINHKTTFQQCYRRENKPEAKRVKRALVPVRLLHR